MFGQAISALPQPFEDTLLNREAFGLPPRPNSLPARAPNGAVVFSANITAADIRAVEKQLHELIARAHTMADNLQQLTLGVPFEPAAPAAAPAAAAPTGE